MPLISADQILPKYSEKAYLSYDPFAGDDVEIEFRKISIVTTRVPHECCVPTSKESRHVIPAGSRVWREQGKCEGAVGTNYCCLPCLDAEIAICGIEKEMEGYR